MQRSNRDFSPTSSCPPTIGTCRYGIDTPNEDELIAATQSEEEIGRFVEADSLGYLSLAGMLEAARRPRDEVCTACWTNDQPVALPRAESAQLRLFEKTRR